MWEALRNRKFLNLKFKRQYVMEGFVLDYYCPELHLAVEIDGTIHNEQNEEDNRRQTVLEQRGVVFFRTNSENVEKHLDSVLKELSQYIHSHKWN